jgi:hypothetical protein
MTVGGIGDQQILNRLVGLGVCPLRMTAFDNALLFQGAKIAVDVETARNPETRHARYT